MSFPKHADYQESPIEWLEEKPLHWQHTRIQYLLLDGRDGIRIGPFGSSIKLEDMVEAGYKVYGQENVIHRDFTAGKRFLGESKFAELSEYELQSGDVVVTMAGTVGRCQVVPDSIDRGIMDSHLVRMRFKPDEVFPPLIPYLIEKTQYVRDQIIVAGRGTTMAGLNSTIIKKLEVVLPDLDEQKAISSFLDVETSKIDGLVSEQRRLTRLLKEKRSAVISHAVTKGLNPNAPMKPSGIQWLGDVPQHWSVVSVKRGITKISQGFSPQCHSEPASDEEWGVVKVGCCNKFDLNESEQKRLPPEIEPVLDYEIQDGDILMSRGNTLDLVGMAALVRGVRPRLLLCDLVYRFRAIPDEFDPAFLVYSLRSKNVRSQIECNAVGSSSTMKKVSQELVRNLLVCRPPLKEQWEISKRMATMSDEFDSLEAEAERAIELLQERRTALISAAVTGKIDVRQFAPQETA